MKKFAGIVMAVMVAGSAFALTPEQAGIYFGTITTTAKDLNAKKASGDSPVSVIMNVQLDGTAEIIAEGNNSSLTGKVVWGTYSAGFISDDQIFYGPLQLIGPAKGTKLTLSQAINIINPPNDGGTISFTLKVKRSKIK